MGTVTEKLVFETSDGEQFDNIVDANNHQHKLNTAILLYDWLEGEGLLANHVHIGNFTQTFTNNPILELDINIKI